MSAGFGRVTIVGVGLLGASLGLALKARNLASSITGVGRRQSSLDTALAMGAIDVPALDLASGVTDADLVVIATPAAQVIDALDVIREHLSPSAVVTDVASTKHLICAHADATWQKPRRFAGSHPMAGGEKFGPEHGHAKLFENTVCLVEEGDQLDPDARDTVEHLWKAVGAKVVRVESARHDALLARTSHLPHIMAAAIAELADRQGDIRRVIGNGFRDVTRVAAGRPELWRDICLTNREAVLEGLDEMRGWIDAFHTALDANDARAVQRIFEAGQAARHRAVSE